MGYLLAINALIYLIFLVAVATPEPRTASAPFWIILTALLAMTNGAMALSVLFP